jgi:hypothetical protein
MRSNIPAISIRQPWAELILSGRKSIEIRTWRTGYRGELWLHTGLKGNERSEQEYGLAALFKGGYVGIVSLDAVIPMDLVRWKLWQEKHLHSGSYHPSMYAWALSSPRRFEDPIPAPGRLGLFIPPPEVEVKLRSASLA